MTATLFVFLLLTSYLCKLRRFMVFLCIRVYITFVNKMRSYNIEGVAYIISLILTFFLMYR